jgi:ammonium transporter, Amt family
VRFKSQLTTDVLVQDIFFLVAAVVVIVAIIGLGLIDMGFVRRKNVVDTWVQKFVASISGGLGMLLIGYPIWYWQFNQAFGVHNSLSTSIKQWWVGGTLARTLAGNINPAVAPGADVLQIFFVFFITFAMVAGALMHGALIERIKPLPLYILSFLAGALGQPIVAYLCWGSTGPLTNHGFHDYIAVTSLYLFVGVFTLMINLRIKPRLGRFEAHETGTAPTPHNLGLVAIGVLLLMFAIPFIVIGSGYIVPGTGYFGISMTSSGIGVVLTNVLSAFIGGGTAGILIAYRRREAVWALFGPIAGYVICGTLFDVGTPLEMLIVSFFGPPAALVVYTLLDRLRIDDGKVAPLALGPGIVGLIASGFLAWHTKTGGYIGLTGKYGFQHAQITPQMQLLGTAVAIAIPLISGAVLAFILDKTIGLRIDPEVEIAGQDAALWGIVDDPLLPNPGGVAVNGNPAAAAPTPTS